MAIFVLGAESLRAPHLLKVHSFFVEVTGFIGNRFRSVHIVTVIPLSRLPHSRLIRG
jgi:hypothetical protein